jgi:hypothetical protein
MYQIGYEPSQPAPGFGLPGGPGYGNGAAWQAPAPNDIVGGAPVGYPPGQGAGGGYSGGGPGGALNGFDSFINQLFSTITAWMNSLRGGSSTQAPASGEQPFSSASLSSWGDPHETFNGTTAGGQQIEAAWDSMTSHPDLLDSDTFAGGYRVSTAVTDPNAAGVTLNKSATVTTQNGLASVTLSNDGTATIDRAGALTVVAAGKSYWLGNGEEVTGNADGSIDVSQRNSAGGSLDTTLSLNGSGGVDVKATATNVDLGGYLVSHADTPGSAHPWGGYGFGNQPSGPALGARAPVYGSSGPQPQLPVEGYQVLDEVHGP